MGEGKQEKKKKVPVHVDTLKTLFPSETLDSSAAPLGNCRRHSADLAFLIPAEQRYCPSFLLPHKDPDVQHPPPPAPTSPHTPGINAQVSFGAG